MPGFAINNTPEDKSKDYRAEFRRKHRWRLVNFSGGEISAREFLYLSKAARPSFKVEAAEVHHDQEVAYFAGKQTWDNLNLEFYDAIAGKGVRGGGLSQAVYNWVTKCTQIPTATVALPSDYKVNFDVHLTNGQGIAEEKWRIFGAWAKETNWNELDYSTSDVQLVTVTVQFDRAERM